LVLSKIQRFFTTAVSVKGRKKKKKTLLSNINYLIAALKKEKRKIGLFRMKHMVHSLFLAMYIDLENSAHPPFRYVFLPIFNSTMAQLIPF